MQVVEVKSTLKVEDILNGVAQLQTEDLEQFLQQVGVLLARRKAPNLSERETLLLKEINNSLSLTTQKKYQTLKVKQQNGSLVEAERIALLNLVEIVEQADVIRLQALVELAQLRGITLVTLMEELDIVISMEQMIGELGENATDDDNV